MRRWRFRPSPRFRLPTSGAARAAFAQYGTGAAAPRANDRSGAQCGRSGEAAGLCQAGSARAARNAIRRAAEGGGRQERAAIRGVAARKAVAKAMTTAATRPAQ